MGFSMNIKKWIFGNPYMHSKEAIASELYNIRWAIENDKGYIERILKTGISQFLLKHMESLPFARIIDVGSGPVSYLLNFVRQNSDRFELTAVDALADEYAEIMEEFRCDVPRNTACYAEELDKYFQPEIFDIVFCSNSLDHTIDIAKSLENMSFVLKDDGFIYLLCNINEKDRTAGDGMHYHNLNLIDGSLNNHGKPVHMPHLSICDFKIHIQTWTVGAEVFDVPRFELILRKKI
jgi:SAM-dependent methyltransferase